MLDLIRKLISFLPWPRKSWEFAGTAVIPVSPVPASRPRVGRFGAYYPKTYRKWRDLAASRLEVGELHLRGPIGVIVDTAVKRPKTTKLDGPKPDIDNFLKAAFDAVTKVGGYWDDDHQVVWSFMNKRWAREGEDPHTTIHFYVQE